MLRPLCVLILFGTPLLANAQGRPAADEARRGFYLGAGLGHTGQVLEDDVVASKDFKGDGLMLRVDVAREMVPIALEKDHFVMAATPDVAICTYGSQRLTRLAFRNLIENAIQHTPPGTTITVSADERTVVIEDDGPGIPESEVQAVFERFHRGPRAAGAGVGLGLAIARQIMERQGGQLVLDASATGGTRLRAIFR